MLYLPSRPEGWAAIRDRERGVGVGIAWDLGTFPHLWVWEQVGGGRFPFFGRARIVALEPVSAWPSDGLACAIERGRALWLPAEPLSRRGSRSRSSTRTPARSMPLRAMAT